MFDRRTVLATFLSASTLPVIGARAATAQEGPRLELTPACDGHAQRTVTQTEGPYFKPDAPLRRDLATDRPQAEKMTVAGLVLDTNCRPVAKALVQIWQADETGAYDNAGFTSARASIFRRARPLVVHDDRAGRLSRPNPPHPCESSTTGRSRADDATLLSRRAAQSPRRPVRPASADAYQRGRRRKIRPLRFRRLRSAVRARRALVSTAPSAGRCPSTRPGAPRG